MRSGTPSERVWFVKSGVVGTSQARDGQPRDAVDQVHLPGSFVGLDSLLRGRHRGEDARVLVAAELCTATAEGFLEWLVQSGPRLAFIERAWRSGRAVTGGPWPRLAP